MKTTEQWLALPDDKLPVELGGVFTPKEVCKHDWVDLILRMPGLCNLKYKCTRCALHVAVKTEFGCVPDPIKLDWDTAKYWQRKCRIKEFDDHVLEVVKVLDGYNRIRDRAEALQVIAFLCRPEDAKYVLIIAAMAYERAKK